MVVVGRYVTCRYMVSRILYLRTGYVLFPALWPEYASASAEDLTVKVMGTNGWGECGKAADTSPWLMTRFTYPMDPRNEWEKLGVGGHPLRWFDRNEAIQFYMGAPNQLSLSNLLREIPVMEWGAAIGANESNYLAALRLHGSNEDAWPPYWGTGESGDDVALKGLSTHTLAVKLVKAMWPVVVAENTITWEQIPREEWLSWSVNTVFDGETMGAIKGSLTRDDSHLQGDPGPLADLHGRRLYRVRGEWHSELGQWTAWDRYLLVGRGPTRKQQRGEVAWHDILTLAQDADRMHVPPTAGERPSDLIEDYCLRAGIPSSYLDIEPSHRRVPLPAPPDTRRGRSAEHPLSFRDPINIYDAMRMVAEWEGHRLWCQRDKVVYRSPLSAPTTEALARAFTYSDGSNPSTAASSWPVHEAPSEEPTEDDREVTHVTVIGGDNDAPVTYTAVLQTTPRRDQSIEAVAGVGRRKDLVEVDRLVRSPAQAASKAYLRAHQLEVDRGDVSVTAPADPHLMLFDPGTLELSHHSLFDGKTMECVGLSESATNQDEYMMTAQMRVKAGRAS
ncbi:MAG: hypothetical protein GF320_02475 [Armatimonadia bacterium]|nr:hypothetical protein [Armatimonadia bacterium]